LFFYSGQKGSKVSVMDHSIQMDAAAYGQSVVNFVLNRTTWCQAESTHLIGYSVLTPWKSVFTCIFFSSHFASVILLWRSPFSVRCFPSCPQMHPVLGDTLSCVLPSDIIEAGLCGELRMVTMATLAPCMVQYSNWPTQLSCIRISFVMVT